ncbi:Eco57I restriction-modification methylase domain-containing protein [bacterium]|nr:Eco57I restriction-modification methylase domain-containing protein [bacterium]MBU1753952.1 Eco57I restriction-modification methylase domain-containing protein [bacterium]
MNAEIIDSIRLQVSAKLDSKNKSQFGQFMTSSKIADHMASLFDEKTHKPKLLDCGAGIGSLTLSAAKTLHDIQFIELWEIDPIMRTYLEKNIVSLGVPFRIHTADFIHSAVSFLLEKTGERFTHAIINPPYKKISSHSEHKKTLRKVGIETVNLYSAFLALTIMLMEQNGQIVAIIPRSFCNGLYYKPFRTQLLKECSIDHIHIFESRNKAFKDDDVLQENIIIKLTKGKEQSDVVISLSHDQHFSDYQEKIVSFKDVVKEKDNERFIHIPVHEQVVLNSQLFSVGLKELSISVSTGAVVDFRVKEYLKQEPAENTVPLLYPHHFVNGELIYPKQHKKPNALRVAPETEKWLMPSDGFYVIVKRFSAKEEKKRVVAYLFNPNEIKATKIGFENHWNVFHSNKHGIDETLARGLACFLNSTGFDNCFRVFSGHTQVNATDLKNMQYPNFDVLDKLGHQYHPTMTQQQIDELVAGIKE